MDLNRPKAILLLALLAGACACLALACVFDRGKWLSSAGLMFDLAGIVQLEISGLFERVLERVHDKYSDEQKSRWSAIWYHAQIHRSSGHRHANSHLPAQSAVF
jgi:hypothetical protein